MTSKAKDDKTPDKPPEIGTDSAATLYRISQDIKTVCERFAEDHSKTPQMLAETYATVFALGNAIPDLMVAVAEISVKVDRLADDIGNVNKNIVSNAVITGEAVAASSAAVEGVSNLIDDHKAHAVWIRERLENFSGTTILARLDQTHSATSELLTSHNDIRGMVAKIHEQVTPLLDRIEKSPLLKMLGVKSND